MYDLNKIPYDYIMEATNIFKGLDLIDRMPEEPWKEGHHTVQGAVIKTPRSQNPSDPQEKEMQKGKMVA